MTKSCSLRKWDSDIMCALCLSSSVPYTCMGLNFKVGWIRLEHERKRHRCIPLIKKPEKSFVIMWQSRFELQMPIIGPSLCPFL